MASIKKLFAFDFDDTIAKTSSSIGVQRKTSDGAIDASFPDWLLDNNIDYFEISNESSNPFYWMESGTFAEFETAKRHDLDYIEANSFEDVYDFSKTSSIDVDTASPINKIIGLMQSAHSDPEAKVVVITARAGSGKITSPAYGKQATTTNREDIKNFLSGHGVDIAGNHISTTGDADGSAAEKARALSSYIYRYNPEIVYFYDDNKLNIDAILGLCDKFYPGININAFWIDKGGNVSDAGSC